MHPVKNTHLFKKVAPRIESITEDELAHQLGDASSTTKVHWTASDLNAAMTWSLTPQGDDYWHNLSREEEDNYE